MSQVAFLDFNDLDFSIRSEQVLRAREENWYARTPFGFAVLRYEDANNFLKDKRLFQGTRKWPEHYGITSGVLANWWQTMLLSLEGETHLRLRKLASPAFSPKNIEKMVPFFSKLANELIDNFQSKGECEFMSEFAEPFSARVIAYFLSIDDSQWKRIAELATKLGYVFSVTIKNDLPIIEEGLQGLLDISKELIAKNRTATDNDFLNTLMAAEVDGKAISDDELLSLVSLFVFAGFDTTRNQIGLGIQSFAQNLDQWKLLGENPNLGRQAVEEVMRVNPTITWVSREASVDFVHKGLKIVAGTTLHLLTISAGSDPEKIEKPDFDITISRPPHFGFGGGMHHCIGHYIARLDMREAFVALSRRLPNIKVQSGAEYLPDSGNTGPKKLPITFLKTNIK